MKVLQINSFFSAGGPPRIMNGIYDTLKENGHECKIAAARERIRIPEDSLLIGTAASVRINALQTRILDNDGFAAKNATKDLITKIKKYDPDIIQIHNLHGYYINLEILFDYLRNSGKPIVWTLHDCWAVTGHCPHFTMKKCDRYKTGCYQCPKKKDYPSSFLLDQSKRNWERKKKAFSGVPNMTIVCVSQWLESIVKGSFLSEYNTKVIYNGVDLTPFRRVESNFRQKYNLTGKKVLLGVALHWVARKGLFDFVELARLLDDDYRIVLVGLKEGEIKDLPHNIIPVPPVYDDHQLAEIYSACDICLNLSYEETFGLVSVESLACGTPIITYDLTAVPEIARMFNAPIVHAGDISSLKTVIEECFDELKAREIYDVSRFEEKKQYQQYYQEYLDLLS